MITNKLPFPDPNKTIEKTMVEKGSTKLRSHVESARNREQETETCYGQRLLREACPSRHSHREMVCSTRESSSSLHRIRRTQEGGTEDHSIHSS